MSSVYISEIDETQVRLIMRKGLRADEREPKWKALRLALAISLARTEPPAESYDNYQPKGGDYDWKQVCGHTQSPDYTDAYRALLAAYHDIDLFDDEQGMFARLLQRHIRRGLAEIRNSWRETHDFYEFLYQELLSRNGNAEAITIDLRVRLIDALNELNFSAEITAYTDGPRLQSFDLLLDDAKQLRALQKASENLSLILGTGPIAFTLPGTPRTVTALIPKPKEAWHSVNWADMRSFIPERDAAQLGVCLGLDPVGEALTFDLFKAPHLLIAGTTNSGKSVTLHTILCSLLSKHDIKSLRLCLIDPKRVEFSAYKGLPHLQGDEPITDMEIAKIRLDDIVAEMGAREAKMAALGYKNLAEWRAQKNDAPPFFVVCIEELADLIMQFPDAESPLVRLAQKGRASGIHLVLATQRPDSVTLSGLLRTNIPSRIALSVQKASESRIILDDVGAELLLGQGDALIKIAGEPMRRVQCAFVSSNDIKAVIEATKFSRRS